MPKQLEANNLLSISLSIFPALTALSLPQVPPQTRVSYRINKFSKREIGKSKRLPFCFVNHQTFLYTNSLLWFWPDLKWNLAMSMSIPLSDSPQKNSKPLGLFQPNVKPGWKSLIVPLGVPWETRDLGRRDHLLCWGKDVVTANWSMQLGSPSHPVPSYGKGQDKINDRGQIRTEHPVLVEDVMPENSLSTKDTYTACIPTKAQTGKKFSMTFCRKPTKDDTVGTELTLLKSRTNLSMEASTQAIKLAEY